MDSIDVRIFCEMAFSEQSYEQFGERHPSATEMGRKLVLDEKTVRVRVNRMEESGFIKYYQASPNLAFFGMRTVSLFRFEALNLTTKYAVINHLDEIPRLVESSDYFGTVLAASIAGATPEEAKSQAEDLALQYELSTTKLGSRGIREPSSQLDTLDWQIVRELRYDAKSTDKDLAEALSVTQRMIGYRVSKLLESGAVQMRAVIDPQRQAGLVFYELELLVDSHKQGTISRWLKEKHGEKIWNIRSLTEEVVLASLFCFTLAEPETSVIEALGQEGVKRCLLFVLKEVIEPKRPNWVDSLVDLRMTAQGSGEKRH
ncbi:MAG TPA: winged helix-turn-helix transcriptional regulator [Nitrososphaerales archaeon]